MHANVVAQEEVSCFHVDGELVVQNLELLIGRRRESVHDVAVIYIHDQVDASIVRENLVKITRIVLRLLELLNLSQLLHQRAIPDATCVGLPVQRSLETPNQGYSTNHRPFTRRRARRGGTRVNDFALELSLQIGSFDIKGV